jgi:hypothetical protein
VNREMLFVFLEGLRIFVRVGSNVRVRAVLLAQGRM